LAAVIATMPTMQATPAGLRALPPGDGLAAMFVRMYAETAMRFGMTAPARAMLAGRQRQSAGR
jgi:hypothetical protein